MLPKEPEAAATLLCALTTATPRRASRSGLPPEPVQPREAWSAVDELPRGWLAMHDADGREYFANTGTGKTQWEPPMHEK